METLYTSKLYKGGKMHENILQTNSMKMKQKLIRLHNKNYLMSLQDIRILLQLLILKMVIAQSITILLIKIRLPKKIKYYVNTYDKIFNFQIIINIF